MGLPLVHSETSHGNQEKFNMLEVSAEALCGAVSVGCGRVDGFSAAGRTSSTAAKTYL